VKIQIAARERGFAPRPRGYLISIVAMAAAWLVGGCSTPAPAPADWLAWRARRLESIGGTNGWTTLTGLHWLQEGENSAGSDPTNQAVLHGTKIPGFIGVFTRRGTNVSFAAAAGAGITVDGQKIGRVDLQSDSVTNPTKLQLGAVTIIAIERGDRMGLRVRDPNSAARRNFKGLRCFPYDPAWRLEGKFVPFPDSRKLRVPDVTGAVQEFVSPGALVFTVQGAEYRLDVADEPGEEDFFVLFHDQSAGDTTYGSGRFLYVARPGPDGRVVIDFNRAYTPPCGFTDFATCPLPPRQNWLPFPVRAGELKPAGSHH
jgi:uncharacterized protein (DUF1684 family)